MLFRSEPRIDVLVNNAGAVFNPRQVTADGLEMHFAVNHMAYFVLTAGLRERLIAAGSARVVNTASDAHRRASLDLDDPQSARGRYNSYAVYGRSKLANILFTRELARRLKGTGVTANTLHPGFVATRFADNSRGLFARIVSVAKNFALTPEQGAETLVHLASSPEVAGTTGAYFHKNRAVSPSAQARSDSDAARLWEISERIART